MASPAYVTDEWHDFFLAQVGAAAALLGLLFVALSINLQRILSIIEKDERNYSAYLPDLPGCIATGKTPEEVKQRMNEAVELHLRGMREDGLPIPEPTSLVEYVEAA